MFFPNLTTLHGNGFDHITNEETRPFIKADNRVERVIRQAIQPEDLLHLGNEAAGHFADTPIALQMGLEFVFLSMCRTSP